MQRLRDLCPAHRFIGIFFFFLLSFLGFCLIKGSAGLFKELPCNWRIRITCHWSSFPTMMDDVQTFCVLGGSSPKSKYSQQAAGLSADFKAQEKWLMRTGHCYWDHVNALEVTLFTLYCFHLTFVYKISITESMTTILFLLSCFSRITWSRAVLEISEILESGYVRKYGRCIISCFCSTLHRIPTLHMIPALHRIPALHITHYSAAPYYTGSPHYPIASHYTVTPHYTMSPLHIIFVVFRPR